MLYHTLALLALSALSANALPQQRPLSDDGVTGEPAALNCPPNAVLDVFGDIRHYSQATAYCSAVVATTTTVTVHLAPSLAAVPTSTAYPAVVTPPVPAPANRMASDIVRKACSCLIPAKTYTITATRYDLTTPTPKPKLRIDIPAYGRGAEPVAWHDMHDGMNVGGRS